MRKVILVVILLLIATNGFSMSHRRMIDFGSDFDSAVEKLIDNDYKVEVAKPGIIKALHKSGEISAIVKFDQYGQAYEEHLVFGLSKNVLEFVSNDISTYMEDNGQPIERGELYAIWENEEIYAAIIVADSFVVYYYSVQHPQEVLGEFMN